MPKSEFRIELENLINRHSLENNSDTPDFILAKFLISAFDNFNAAVNEREEWYGRQKHLSEINLDNQDNPSTNFLSDINEIPDDVLLIDKQNLIDAINEAQKDYDYAVIEAKKGLLPYVHVEKFLIKLNNFKWVLSISKSE